MFYGEFEYSIDDKQRITIPAKFRAWLAPGVVITKGIEPCLLLYSTDGWAKLVDKVSTLAVTKPQARELRRRLFGGAADLVPDRQGRIKLPAYLREYANLDKQAVIVGLLDYCEIWNPEQWRARQERSDSDPEGTAEQFASLDI